MLCTRHFLNLARGPRAIRPGQGRQAHTAKLALHCDNLARCWRYAPPALRMHSHHFPWALAPLGQPPFTGDSPVESDRARVVHFCFETELPLKSLGTRPGAPGTLARIGSGSLRLEPRIIPAATDLARSSDSKSGIGSADALPQVPVPSGM